LALVWVSVTLQGIFIEERDAAKAAIIARRRALEQYALVALEKKLRTALADARPRIETALEEPLSADQRLLMVEDGKQRLPRLSRYVQGFETPASRLYRELEHGAVKADGPWGERLALLAELKKALAATDSAAITESVRAFLNHQSRFILPVTQDLPYRLYFLETFIEGATPDRKLLQALFRDGLRGTQGRRLVGLQPLLLSNSERFTKADFEFLAGRITEVSREARIVHDDFDAAASNNSNQPVSVPKSLKGPSLIARGSWYAAPLEDTALFGVAVDLDGMLRDIASDMRQGGLLAAGDGLRKAPILREVMNVTELPLTVHSDALKSEADESDRRYAVKTATGIALGALVVGIALLIALFYRRERRFLEGKASFIATVSHELRTPIASLRLMGETLERRLEGVESARDFPSRIVGEAERLNFLVENILSFNRLEKAKVKTNLQSLTIAELVDGVRAGTEAFTKKSAHIRIEAGTDLALRADGELLKLLFSNLINNSCKYNARDAVDIEVRAAQSGGRTMIQFADNGTGIPEGEWESVFTEFVRSGASRAKSGFGLGLALCRRIMELHDGTIRVIHSSEAGTTFEMVFPMV
jgi:signal transduction histidine kinase